MSLGGFARSLLRKGDVMMGIDVRSGFNHVDVDTAFQSFLGFEWRGQYHVFQTLPFGANFSPFCFCSLMTPVADYLRRHGIKVMNYCDDFLMAMAPSEAWWQSQLIKDTFERLGLLVHPGKCEGWDAPVTRLTSLGFEVDTDAMTLTVPEHRMREAQSLGKDILGAGRAPARTIARLLGKIQSFSLCTGIASRLYSRHLYNAIESRSSWGGTVSVASPKCRRELTYICTMLHREGARSIRIDRGSVPFYARLMYSDAGAAGIGAWTARQNCFVGTPHKDEWDFTVDKAVAKLGGAGFDEESSTARELRALLLGVRSFQGDLQGLNVLFRLDSQAATLALLGGGSKVTLIHDLVVEFFELCAELKISATVQWVPRDLNVIADALSKIGDRAAVAITDDAFRQLEALFGDHTVDAFASEDNFRCSRWMSRWHFSESAGNALYDTWPQGRAWAFPPFALVKRTLAIMERQRTTGTLVVPGPSARPDWWNIVFPRGEYPGGAASWVKAIAEIPRSCFVAQERWGGEPVRQTLLALSIDFTHQRTGHEGPSVSRITTG